ncbi:MAG: hypothetical protein ACRCZ9_10050 [Fusobacteriaceae bacterium]
MSKVAHNRTSPEVEDKIIDMIKSRKFRTYEIASKLQVSEDVIRRVCKERDVVNKKYNEELFECVDTEEKAYWLGFLYADGNVCQKIKNLEIGLAKKDLDHLIKAREFFGNPIIGIQYRAKTKSYRLSIGNKKICSDLVKLGIVPNKSLTIEFAPFLSLMSKELHKHFLRGIFDGDGSVGIYNGSAKSSFVGNDKTVTQINSFLIATLEFNPFKKIGRKLETNGYSVQYSIKETKKLLSYLYDDATIFLDRKQQIAVLIGNS